MSISIIAAVKDHDSLSTACYLFHTNWSILHFMQAMASLVEVYSRENLGDHVFNTGHV